jgi:MSHA biogenesis protein MshQ
VNNRAPVSSIATGKIDLGLTQGGVKPSVQCFDGKSNSCAMEFTGGANFSIGVADDKAGNTITATIRALKANDSQSACVPAFTDEKPVQYSCDYVAPNSGAAEMRLETNAGATGTFACNASSQLKTKFNEAGIATVQLAYPDAGKVALKASFETATGRSEFVMAPDHFTLAAVAPMRAGADFKVDLEARNKDGKVTPNFNRDTLLAKATETTVALDCLGAGMAGSLEAVKTEFSKGKASATLNFSEAGYLDLRASQSGFLDSKLTTSGSTGGIVNGACQAKTGPFVPAYFQAELNDANRAKTNFYYSREPIPLKLSARNAKGEVTKNYPLGHGSEDVIKFSAVRPDNGAPFDPVLGAVSGEFEARYFVAGEAPQAGPAQPGARIAQPAFTFANALTAPSQIRLRAANDATDANLRITSVYTPTGNAAAEPEQARPYIRTGRLRLGKRFGRVGTQPLEMPLTVEYWSGKSWVLNTQDSFTVIPASAFAQQPGGDGATRPTANTLANVALANGAGILKVTGNAAGWIDIAVNLGPTNQQDTSCLATHPASTGAGLPWLRSPLACNGQAGTPSTDPSARATFGIFPIENRRIIHVREVFN